MKVLIVASLLVLPVFAFADNCYVHERGTDSWLACKEQAATNEAWWVEHRADQRQLQAETSTALTNDTNNEQILLLLQAILAAQQGVTQ